ncbi:MAG: LPXTG cell wall anchor domain-containing protein, partial [Oscillospiraceae bacterium]|nr:LPXTG cell wall anchor domain-containing protein [Oscillospiraceae bacterium]
KLADEVVATFLDVSLSKKIGSLAQTKIDKTISPIQISFNIPNDILDEIAGQEVEYFKVIRYHGGEVTALDTTYQGNVITFSTDKFSTYALVYKLASMPDENLQTPPQNIHPLPEIVLPITPNISQQESSSSVTADNPSTGAGTNIHLIFIALMLIVTALILLKKKEH